MFPLEKRVLIRGAKAHQNAGLGIAADYVARYATLYAPFDGKVATYSGVQGGKWLRLTRSNGDRIEFAHLSLYRVKSGLVREGDNIATTGNTGRLTTGAHLHAQIFDKVGRLDPERYTWDNDEMEKIKALTAQVKRLLVEVRKLTGEVLVFKETAESYEKDVKEEKSNHRETVEKLEAEFIKRTTAETKLKACLKNKFADLKFMEKLRILLKQYGN